MATEIIISNFFLDNQSGKKVRAEVQYNENTKTLTVILRDKIDTLYIDANPNKKVDVPTKWILQTSDEAIESGESDSGKTG